MKSIGILGGTFNPPHVGHLLIAEYVKEELNLDQVWFIPTYEPPHKEKSTAKPEHRVEMLQFAIEDNPMFHLNKIEINRTGKSYTIETIRSLKEQFPTFNFYFIIGADMVEYLPNWKKVDQLIQLLTFVGVKRPGYSLDSPYPFEQVPVPEINISSSFIRKRLEAGKSIKYLVPEKVVSYIKEHQLYEKKRNNGGN